MIKLTKHDAVFGRGRKKSSIRLGSTYRSLIETHWAPYSTISARNVKDRRSYIKHIINGVTKKGGRFIVREGEHLRQLFPNKKGDQNEIVRKICRALFNEKTRQKKLNEKKAFQEKVKNAPVADDDTYEREANSTENESETSKNKEDEEDYEEDEDEHSSGKSAASLGTGLNGFIPNILETNNANVLDVATTMEANTAGVGWDLQGWYKEHYGGDQHGDKAHDNKDNHQEMMEMLGDIDAFL